MFFTVLAGGSYDNFIHMKYCQQFAPSSKLGSCLPFERDFTKHWSNGSFSPA